MKHKKHLRGTFLLSVLFSVLLSTQASSKSFALPDFDNWLKGIQQEALEQGISPSLVQQAFDEFTPNEKIFSSDQRQPEFSLGFWEYFERGVNSDRIAFGKEKFIENQELLEKISKKYNVQPRFLVAFWGLETDFGRVKGSHPLVQALATLAYHPRRAAFFRSELMQLLKIIDAGHMNLEEAKGSWAGAFGHTQFMPSTFAAYAVDGNDDGKIHLIDSPADALYSAANYLKNLGWDDQKTWGREVTLPKGFDLNLAKLYEKQPLEFWKEQGVTAISGANLPNTDIEAALIVPAGLNGPAFLVYENFHRIMRWNKSIFFALNVSLLADAIGRDTLLQTQKPAGHKALKTSEILQIQQNLAKLGYEVGAQDGIIGRQTRAALRDFQRQNALPADGYPGVKTRQLLAG